MVRISSQLYLLVLLSFFHFATAQANQKYFECSAVDFDGQNNAGCGTAYGCNSYTNTNPDFFECANGMGSGITTGILGPIGTALGTNGLPILINPNNSPGYSTQENFDQWWLGPSVGVTNPGAVGPTFVLLALTEESGKWVHKVANPFHPLKGRGFDDPAKFPQICYGDAQAPHVCGYKTLQKQNAGFFALKCASDFVYAKQYGPTGNLLPMDFTFTGDDDVWIYINNKLAVDIGGIHGAASRTVNVHSLGLSDGCSYPIHLFQAVGLILFFECYLLTRTNFFLFYSLLFSFFIVITFCRIVVVVDLIFNLKPIWNHVHTMKVDKCVKIHKQRMNFVRKTYIVTIMEQILVKWNVKLRRQAIQRVFEKYVRKLVLLQSVLKTRIQLFLVRPVLVMVIIAL